MRKTAYKKMPGLRCQAKNIFLNYLILGTTLIRNFQLLLYFFHKLFVTINKINNPLYRCIRR